MKKVIEHSDMLFGWSWHRRQWRQLTVGTIPLHMTVLLTCRTDNVWTLQNTQHLLASSHDDTKK